MRFKKTQMKPEVVEACLKHLKEKEGQEDVYERHAQAIKEGMKDEQCSCGKLLPAHMDWVRCQEDNCPCKSKDSKSLLDTLFGK